jgi:hypothetical protein
MERLKISMEKLEKLMRFFVYKIGVMLLLVSSVISLVLSILNNEENVIPYSIIFVGLCYLFLLLLMGLIWLILNIYKLYLNNKERKQL